MSTTIDRTPFNALVDSDGTPGSGSVWDKAAIALVLLDEIDDMFETPFVFGSTVTAVGTITSVAGMFINDTTNAVNTTGLTINQGAADDEILSLKSSDIAHGMTDLTETDTYGSVRKHSATDGGVRLEGFSETTGGVSLLGDHTTDDTAKSTGASGAVILGGRLKSGTSITVLGANANIAVIQNNGTTRFIYDAEGSAHADVEWITFDTHDDLALLDALDTRMSIRDAVTNAFGEALQYHKADLEAAGIVHFYDDGPRAMVNFTRLTMLHTGAIRQMARQHAAVIRALLAAGVVTSAQLEAA